MIFLNGRFKSFNSSLDDKKIRPFPLTIVYPLKTANAPAVI